MIMNEKKIVMLGLSLVFFLFLMSFSSALIGNVTLTTPANNAIIAGTSPLNVSITGIAGNFTCSYYAKSSITSNSSWSLLATRGNNTATSANTTFNTLILHEANNYQFNATCGNATGIWSSEIASQVNTGITVDNSVPTAPTLSPSTNTVVNTAGSKTFTGTVVDGETTNCTYLISRGGAVSGTQDSTTGTATYSGTSCTFTKTFTDTKDNGDWYWYITASDSTNETQSAVNIYQVQLASSGGSSPIVADQIARTGTINERTLAIASGEDSNNTTLWFIGGGVILAFIVIYFLIRKR